MLKMLQGINNINEDLDITWEYIGDTEERK